MLFYFHVSVIIYKVPLYVILRLQTTFISTYSVVEQNLFLVLADMRQPQKKNYVATVIYDDKKTNNQKIREKNCPKNTRCSAIFFRFLFFISIRQSDYIYMKHVDAYIYINSGLSGFQTETESRSLSISPSNIYSSTVDIVCCVYIQKKKTVCTRWVQREKQRKNVKKCAHSPKDRLCLFDLWT